jgi:ribosomal 50S subunit-associated protein YjgA (DUF615 family)
VGLRDGTRLAPEDALADSWRMMLLRKGDAADTLLDTLATATVARGADVAELRQRVRVAQAAPQGRAGRHARRALVAVLRPLADWKAAPPS